MEDINLHYRFLNWRGRIREIRDGRAVRYRERLKRMLRDGDVLRYHGNSDEVGCFVAARPLSKRNRYFEVTIIDTGVRGMIAVGLVPQLYKLDHQPGWLPNSVALHADDGKLYNGNTLGQQFGPKCSRGDRIGCGISLDSDDGQLTVFFTKNGKELLEYVGKGKCIVDVGLAQALRPLNTRFHYYELEITDAGEKCYIALGLAVKDYPKNSHPGWSRGSIAYHADDGKLFQGSGVGDVFGPRCFAGDVMGCGIMFPRDYSHGAVDDDWDLEVFPRPSEVQNDLYAGDDDGEAEDLDGETVTVFFTRNGKVVGRRKVALPAGGFYPTIGMMSTGEKVRVELHPLSG
ncbi:SPRY domain-containing protein 3-like isoform X2 [Nerophis ophidion]|uniref:SPRY domain-containing protein 3-like isoform X2 n=1 Tax=Nerophis ophidion TaxID=159077 RepID=UPI002ADF8E93|nr:SPRY domain-containing protein 3-like isoform X2 [Nerophis ophidion]